MIFFSGRRWKTPRPVFRLSLREPPGVIMARRSLARIVGDGDRRTALEAIRDKLAAELQGASGRDAATLGKQLAETIRELDSLPGGREASPVDDLTARREARRSKTAGS